MLTSAASAAFTLHRKARLLLRDDGGATAIEYSMIAGIMAIAIVAAFGLIQDPLSALFDMIGTTLSAA